jgi:hypothetical protein
MVHATLPIRGLGLWGGAQTPRITWAIGTLPTVDERLTGRELGPDQPELCRRVFQRAAARRTCTGSSPTRSGRCAWRASAANNHSSARRSSNVDWIIPWAVGWMCIGRASAADDHFGRRCSSRTYEIVSCTVRWMCMARPSPARLLQPSQLIEHVRNRLVRVRRTCMGARAAAGYLSGCSSSTMYDIVSDRSGGRALGAPAPHATTPAAADRRTCTGSAHTPSGGCAWRAGSRCRAPWRTSCRAGPARPRRPRCRAAPRPAAAWSRHRR